MRWPSFLLLAALLFSVSPSVAQTCTVSWASATSGDWNDASRWTPNQVPGAADVACITVDGTYTVTLASGSPSVQDLVLGGANGTQTLVLNRAFAVGQTATIRANGVLNWVSNYITSGAITNNGLVRLTGTSGSRGVRGTGASFTNTGTVEHSSTGSFYVYNTASVSNEGLWDLTGDGDIFGFTGLGTFRNEAGATVRKSGGSGVSQFGSGGLVVENEGTLDVQTGTVQFNSVSTHTDAVFAVAEAALLFFSSGGVRFEGTTTGSPQGVVQLNNPFTVADGAVWNLSGTGMTWTSNYQQEGALTNRGLVRLTGTSGSRGVRGTGASFTNTGTVEHSSTGSFYVYDTAEAVNTSLWDLTGDGDIFGFTGLGTFRNEAGATVRKSGGDAVSQFGSGGLVVENRGGLDVQTGELRFDRPSTHVDAAFIVAADALLRFNAGGVRFEGTTTGSPEGTVQLDDEFTVADGAIWDLGGTGMTWTSNYQEEGALTNRGLVRLTGTSGSRGVRGDGASFTNTGTVEHSSTGSFYVYDTAEAVNTSLWDLTGDGDIFGFTSLGTFRNEAGATVRKSGGDAVSQFASGGLIVENEGTLDVQTGEVRFDRPSTHIDAAFTVAADALLRFNAGGVRFEGTMTGAPEGTIQLDDEFTAADGAIWDLGGTGVTWVSNYQQEGTLTNRGLVRLTGTSVSRGVRGAGASFINAGTVEHSGTGGFFVYDTAEAVNRTLWDVTGGGDLFGFTDLGTFRNEAGATFRKSGGPDDATTIVSGRLVFENRGTVEAQVGEIRFQRPSSHTRAELTAAADAQIRFGITPTFAETVGGEPEGRILVATSIIADNGRLAFGGTGLEWSGGYLESGTLTNQGLLRLTGTSGSRGARGNDTRFRNEGTVEHSGTGSFFVYNGAIATNASTWSTTEGGDILGLTDLGTFRNEAGATFEVSGDGADTRFASGGLRVENAGTLDVAAGATMRAATPFTHLEGGVIQGEGTFAPGSQFTLAGGILPGASPGTLTWSGAYQPETTASLDIEIGGTEAGDFDQLAVTGSAQANGELAISLLPSYVASDGDTFPVLTAANYSGGFEFMGLVNTDADLAFYPSASATGLTLTAFTGIPTASGALALAPDEVQGDQLVTLAITGTGFAPDLSLQLECVQCLNPDEQATVPGLIQALTPTTMTAVFDLPFEAIGRYDVVVRDPRDGEARGALTITPGDLTVEIEAVDAEAAEATDNRGTFVIRSNARNIVPLEVAVEVSGTATRFVDYTTNATRSIVRIPAGRTSARFSVLPLADAEAEGDETVTLTLVDDDADYEVIGTGSATVTIADGPAPTDLSLVRALPGRGGAGPVTLRIAGQAMMDGTTATLTCAGTPYDAQLATAGPEGTLLTAQFNLTGQKPELCDLAVTSGGATATLPQAFRVVSVRRPADLTLDLISPERRRRGRSVRHRVIVTNRGNVDAYMVPVEISVNGGASIQPEFAVENPVEEPDLPNMPDEFPGWDAIPTQVDIDGRRELSIVVPVIPAGGEVELTFRSDASSLSASVLTPLLVDYIPGTTTGTLAPEYQEALEQMAQNGTGSVALCWTRKLGFAAVATLGQAFGNLSQCVRSASLAVVAAANQAVSAYAGTATTLSYQRTATIMAGGLVSCLNAAGRSIPWSRGLALAVNLASAAYDAYHECPEEPEETETEEVASFDPNDKLGPVGATEARYIRGDEGRVYYTVRFENLVSATAPAAEVFITDSLDVSVFDPTSFRVHSVSFADQTVTAPPGLSAWNAEVDLRPSDPILLQISGSIDDEGLISWTFVSLDPETLDLPEDPLIGFLPPNVTPPEGEGSVTFSVALREGLPDGTEVANEARIVFDVNEPIDTPVWSNTIDRTAPTSSVTSVGYSAASDTTLVLYLSGSDAGSGVLSYDIYASRDGGPFEFAFTADTDTPTFEAERGSLYGFFSIARDYVDNLEDPKTEAEAVTTWPVDSESTDPSLPDAVSLVAPYPNPARGSAVLQFGLPAPTRVDLRVYDVQGREIARLAEGEHTAGWHRLPWTFSDLAPGVYLVRFQADDETFTERLTVVR